MASEIGEDTQPQSIFVGDIQGCGDELDSLTDRAENRFGSEFLLYAVGDLINRGPCNLRVLERVRERVEAGRAFAILGNHEIALLRVVFGQRQLAPRDTFGEVLESSDADDWIDWIRHRPLAVTGEIAGERFAMVHASVHPDWSLAELSRRARALEARLGSRCQSDAEELLALDAGESGDASLAALRDDLGRLVSCRTVAESSWSSREPGDFSDAWHAHWAQRNHDYGVVYGHWSMQGLHVANGLRGLDTGCVHHGRGRDGFLTAWLPGTLPRSSGKALFGIPDKRLWQIPSLRHYYGDRS